MNKIKYEAHRRGANTRNIPFLLSFEEWSNIWEQSGHWEERGKKKGQYCMSRIGDTGPYAVGNVFIQLHSENMSQAQKGKTQTEEHKAKRSALLKGRPGYMKGSKQTEEQKKKSGDAVRAAYAKKKLNVN